MVARKLLRLVVLCGLLAGGLGSTVRATVAPSVLTPPPGDGPVVVRAGFQLLDVNQIDDQGETFEFAGILQLQWRDVRQAFDPAVEGVEEKMYVGDFQFNEIAPSWYPEVILLNVAGLFERSGVVLRVRPDGTCTLVQSVNAVAKTRLNLRRYPFDRQQLEAVFTVLGFDKSEVVLEPLPQGTPDLRQIRIPQWRLEALGTTVQDRPADYGRGDRPASAFVVQLEVQRHAMFIMRLVVMPLFLVVVLSWSVFWMDRASLGDRMSVSFVGLLTAVAYQIVLGDILPHISYVTLINGFLNFSFFLMCATVVANLIVGAYDRAGQPERGDRLDHLCRWAFPLSYVVLLTVASLVAFLLF